jgi:4-hydroxybenzoate polyprenyltransferase
VATWVAGFDLIYSCQDVAFDRTHRLFSFPARFGIGASLIASAGLHVVTVTALALAGAAAGAGAIYATAVAVAALLLVVEHALVRPGDLSRVNRAFFTVNGWLSVLFLGGVLVDLARVGGVP